METPAQPGGGQRWYYKLLLPFIAFTGVAVVLFFGGENWLYKLPFFKNAAQVRSLNTSVFQGQVQCPLLAQIGTTLTVRGWVRSLMPGVRPSKIVVYLDGHEVGETVPSPAAPGDSSGNAFQVDFFLAGARPGDHTIRVQAILEGHEPIWVVEAAPLSIQ